MSNIANNLEEDCRFQNGCDVVSLIIHPRERDLGGFSVRRVLPSVRQKMVGPWIFFDHMGPADFEAGTGINVRPHPHINLATVTYLFEGEMLHRDSLGSEQVIRPGDINLMVAGKGIVHSEREREEVRNSAHRIHALQLWLTLPEADEETDPAFYHYPSDQIPALKVEGVPLRVMMGSAYGVSSPVKTFAETLYVEARLEPGQSLRLPDSDELAIYVAGGQVSIGADEIPQHAMAVLKAEQSITVTADQPSQIAIIGGQSMSKRYIDWNFVSSRAERIKQAREDWLEQRFPSVPGDEEEYIPLPE